MQKAAFGVLFRRPWGAWVWSRYYGSIFANRRPADWTARRDAVHKNLSEPGRFAALQRMLPAMSRDCETRLDSVNKPVLVVMGTKDPDFADPIAEAKLLAQRSHGTVHLIEGGGHYPHAEDPAKFAQIAADFFAKVATP